MSDRPIEDSIPTRDAIRDCEFDKFSKDLDDNRVVRIKKGETLESYYSLLNLFVKESDEIDSYIVEDIFGAKVIHFFNEGEEQFYIAINKGIGVGAVRNPPADSILELRFANLFARQGFLIGTVAAQLFSIGGSSIAFEILSDESNNFAIIGNDIVFATNSIEAGSYPITFQIIGSLGEKKVEEFSVVVLEPLDLSAIVLSEKQVISGLPSGRFVSEINANGGAFPYVFEIEDDQSGLFSITGNSLETQGVIGSDGTLYDITIKVTDNNGNELLQEFTIEVTAALINTYSLNLNGTTQRAEFVKSPETNFENTTPFSISAWMKRDTNGNTDCLFCNYSTNNNNGQGITAYFDTNGNNRLSINLNNTNQNQIRTRFQLGSATIGAWVHVVITYDGSSDAGQNNTSIQEGVSVFLNGAIVNKNVLENGLTGTIQNAEPKNYFGSRGNGSVPFNGSLDQIVIYNKELSSAEVLEAYNGGVIEDLRLKSYLPNILHGWECEENGVDVKRSVALEFVNEDTNTFSTDVP